MAHNGNLIKLHLLSEQEFSECDAWVSARPGILQRKLIPASLVTNARWLSKSDGILHARIVFLDEWSSWECNNIFCVNVENKLQLIVDNLGARNMACSSIQSVFICFYPFFTRLRKKEGFRVPPMSGVAASKISEVTSYVAWKETFFAFNCATISGWRCK